MLAFEVFQAMQLHFMKKGYDGWKYGFRKKIKTDEIPFKWQFAAIEREYPTVNELVKFYYPTFLNGSFKPKIASIRPNHKAFIMKLEHIKIDFPEALARFRDFKDLHGQGVVLPRLYEEYQNNKIDYETIVVMFLVIPTLNKVVSNEPFVYEKFKAKVDFDKRFFSMYLSVDTINLLRQVALDKFNVVK
jgi:hypothetical protein